MLAVARRSRIKQLRPAAAHKTIRASLDLRSFWASTIGVIGCQMMPLAPADVRFVRFLLAGVDTAAELACSGHLSAVICHSYSTAHPMTR